MAVRNQVKININEPINKVDFSKLVHCIKLVKKLLIPVFIDTFQQARSKDLPSYNSPSVQQILDPSASSNLGASSSVRQKCCQSVT